MRTKAPRKRTKTLATFSGTLNFVLYLISLIQVNLRNGERIYVYSQRVFLLMYVTTVKVVSDRIRWFQGSSLASYLVIQCIPNLYCLFILPYSKENAFLRDINVKYFIILPRICLKPRSIFDMDIIQSPSCIQLRYSWP